jgi:NADH-quinone oxidoreductase subunit D
MKDILGNEITEADRRKIEPYEFTMNTTEVEESVIRMNIGPSHPATHGTLHLIAELQGEQFTAVDCELGYLHTGFEKLGETRSYNQFITLSDRMNYISPLNNNFGFAIAVEDLLGIEIPKRAQYIRVLLCELGRIADHFLNVGFFALDLGAFSAFLWAFELREMCYDIFEKITGTRLTTSYARIGGVAMDLPDGIVEEILSMEKDLDRALRDFERVFHRNRLFLDRVQGVGYIAPEEALQWAITGPLLRGSGIPYDLRKAKPYSSYDEFDFEVITFDEGDCYARYMVRFYEMKESFHIVKQVLDRLPDGPVNALTQKVADPSKQAVYTDMESLIHHFKLVMPGKNHGVRAPLGHYYSATESPTGELGFFLVSDGGHAPYRVRVRPPSFYAFQTCKHVLPGHVISDFPAYLGTMHVIAGELDR